MLQQEVEIINKLGLHARASAKLTQVAGRFQANVWVGRSGRRVNAKSIMGVMMLAAAIAADPDAGLETAGDLSQLGRGPGVEPELVDDLSLLLQHG